MIKDTRWHCCVNSVWPHHSRLRSVATDMIKSINTWQQNFADMLLITYKNCKKFVKIIKYLCLNLNSKLSHSLTCSASMKDLVPERAMVPRLLTRSAFVIPTPVSIMVRVLSSLLGMRVISSSFSTSRTEGSVKLWYLILSRACNEKKWKK